jgi:putative membrane protein (TIGR04086 family)
MVNMKAQLSQVHWGLVLITSVVLYVLTFILGIGLSLLLQVFLNGGHPDQRTSQVFTVINALLVMVVTGFGAWWAARKGGRAATLHGILVGMAVALLSLLLDLAFSGAIHSVGLTLYVLTIVAGSLGGLLAGRR